MKFKSILVAAAGFLALATATTLSPQVRDVAAPNPAQCDHYCHQPWLKCVAEHGGTEEAKRGCNCDRFGDPRIWCRHAGCVQPPQNCHKAELNVAARTVAAPDPAQCDHYCHQPWLKCVAEHGGTEEAKRGCNCDRFGDPKLWCRHAGCVEPPKNCNKRNVEMTTIGSKTYVADHQPLPSPITNRCRACAATIQECKAKCKVRGTCDNHCNCHGGLDPVQCSRCPLPCKNSQSSTVDQVHSEDSKNKTLELDVVDEVSKRVPNPCVICDTSIKFCKKKCIGDAGCEKNCACQWKKQLTCRECGVKCDPQVEGHQENTSSDFDDSGTQLGITVLPDPRDLCQLAINSCQKQCHTPGACDDACRCAHKNHGVCKGQKIHCDCIHNCPE